MRLVPDGPQLGLELVVRCPGSTSLAARRADAASAPRVLFAFPNFQWILIPGIIMVLFGREIATGLRLGAKAKVL